MVESRNLREGNEANTRFTVLHLRRADFVLITPQLGRILWDMVLERRGVWESWLTFKDPLCQAQEQSILMYMDEHRAHDKAQNIERKYARGGSRVRSPRRNMEKLSM